MNIEGKRSGEGFVSHKAILVNALSRALAERVVLIDFTIGRKGFLNYLKSLGGSNIVKVAGIRSADHLQPFVGDPQPAGIAVGRGNDFYDITPAQ